MSAVEAIRNRVTEIVTVDLQLEVPDAETDLIESCVLDSLVFVDLIARIEEEFRFEIDLGELEFDEFSSVSRMADYIVANGGVLSEVKTIA
jgi:acyl carrier protein